MSLAEVFHPWVRWEGLDLDLRVRLAAPAPAASGNLGFRPVGIEVKQTWFLNGMADERPTVSVKNLILGYSILTV